MPFFTGDAPPKNPYYEVVRGVHGITNGITPVPNSDPEIPSTRPRGIKDSGYISSGRPSQDPRDATKEAIRKEKEKKERERARAEADKEKKEKEARARAQAQSQAHARSNR